MYHLYSLSFLSFSFFFFFFFFNDTATTEIYTLSLHDALPICRADVPENERTDFFLYIDEFQNFATDSLDRKSTRLNSSHTVISYAVFCLKKKKKKKKKKKNKRKKKDNHHINHT